MSQPVRTVASPRYKNESLNNTGVTAGSYTSTNLTVAADGRITAAASGSANNVSAYAIGPGNVTSSGPVGVIFDGIFYNTGWTRTNGTWTTTTGGTFQISATMRNRAAGTVNFFIVQSAAPNRIAYFFSVPVDASATISVTWSMAAGEAFYVSTSGSHVASSNGSDYYSWLSINQIA